jgi:hypothetical protein
MLSQEARTEPSRMIKQGWKQETTKYRSGLILDVDSVRGSLAGPAADAVAWPSYHQFALLAVKYLHRADIHNLAINLLLIHNYWFWHIVDLFCVDSLNLNIR